MDYLIEEIKCGITDGGFGCGPISGNVVTTIKYKDGNKSSYLSLIEISGIPEFHLSDNDIYDDLIKEEFTDEYQELLDNTYINEFNGIELGEYSELFNSLSNAKELDAKLIRLIILITRCELSYLDNLINQYKHTYLSYLVIPKSDIEEDYS